MSRRKTFKWMFFLSFLKFIVWIICFSAIFIGVLYANKNIGTNIKKTNEWIDGVFNIFLFIVGSSIIMISIIFYHIVESIMNKKKKNIKKGGKIYD